MRNLTNIGHSVDFPISGPLSLTAVTWDTSNDALICAFGPSEEDAGIELKRVPQGAKDGDYPVIAAWDASCPNPSLLHDRILCLHYFPDSSTTCLVLAGGDIVAVREEPLPNEEQVEIVGSVDAGIAAASWSPDEELIAIVTSADTLLFMTRHFESTINVVFSLDDVKVSNHVSVGWGKAETQFKGKRAKALRDPTVPEHVDEGSLSEFDDGSVYISWRGDGAYLVINTVEDKNRRMIRVYSRQGILDSVSEPVDYLEGPISWRPAGNLIAGVQRLKEKLRIVFFERNGLRHGEFDLSLAGPFDPQDQTSWITALHWNANSSVLAICFPDRIQLWTMSNYHYYLKQEVSFANRSDRDLTLSWHPERPLRLTAFNAHAFQRLEFTTTVCTGPTYPPFDYGLVAVIDGKKLKLTPFRAANIPPPLSLHELSFSNEVIDATVDISGTSIAVLTKLEVLLFHYDPTSTLISLPSLEKTFTMASIPSLPVFRQIAIGKNKNIFLLGFDLTLMCDRVLTFDDDIELIIDSYSDVEFESVVTLSSSQPSGDVYAQLGDGRLMRCEPPAYNSLNGVLGALQLQFPAAVAQSGVVEIDEEQIAFGLTSGGALYANDRLLTRNCTSMITTPAHLIFTTSQHLLKFVHLTSVNELEVPSDSPETDERCRSIERGARLVTVIPSTYSVVLQMPRGNLETIYPRALVLASIRKSTAQGDYSSAFMTCRSQRVDMNIIHDHDPGRFMESVGEFIRQVKKSEYIDLFLSSLRDEDVSITMYKETSPKGPASIDDAALINGTAPLHTGNSQLAPSNSSKVNRICDTFLAELQSQSAKHLRNIITAHVCKSPPDLRTGLSVVAKLREQSHDLAERAAEHICFLADVNRLYDEALGLYDLDLTLLIAQQSQKDPREYLPYLQSLQEQTELRRKFTIDNDLGRHSRALDHLHALNDFDELKRYVQKHELYSAAIELYRYQDAQMNALMRLYANFLTGRNRFKEAGIAYEFLSDYTAASEAYRQANMWREALSSATLAPEGEVSVAALATDLAATCEETKDFFAAATIAREYKDSPEEAVRFFCKGYHFSDAIRLVGITGQRQWIEELVNPGLIDGAASMSEMLGECREQLRNQVPRLRELRAKKAEDPLAFFDGGAGGGGDVPDDMSIAPTDASTSGGTFMTRYTGRNSGTVNTATSRRTSKNRRREERKRARGKKGTVYEEEYLVNSIARLIERVDGVRGEVGRLVEGLLRRRMRERAVAVERVMGEVVEGCRSCVDEVFQVERKATLAEGEDDNRMGERPVGADGVLWDSLDNIGRKKEPPVVKKFERLSLLS